VFRGWGLRVVPVCDAATEELLRQADEVVAVASVVAEVDVRHDAILAALGNPAVA
jgi:hypothetical protein